MLYVRLEYAVNATRRETPTVHTCWISDLDLENFKNLLLPFQSLRVRWDLSLASPHTTPGMCSQRLQTTVIFDDVVRQENRYTLIEIDHTVVRGK